MNASLNFIKENIVSIDKEHLSIDCVLLTMKLVKDGKILFILVRNYKGYVYCCKNLILRNCIIPTHQFQKCNHSLKFLVK